MKKITLWGFALIISAFLANCKQPQTTISEMPQDYLFDKTWTLETFGEKKYLKASLQGVLNISFALESRQVNGCAGCNRFFANYTLKNGQLSIYDIGTTKKLCPAETMNVETQMLKILGKADNYDVSKETLRLKRGDKILATFSLSK